MYRVLKTEPDSNPSSYLRTRPCQSGSFRQFHPSWVSKYRWLHYSRHVNGAYCRACVCSVQVMLVVSHWGTLLQPHLHLGLRCLRRLPFTQKKITTFFQ